MRFPRKYSWYFFSLENAPQVGEKDAALSVADQRASIQEVEGQVRADSSTDLRQVQSGERHHGER